VWQYLSLFADCPSLHVGVLVVCHSPDSLGGGGGAVEGQSGKSAPRCSSMALINRNVARSQHNKARRSSEQMNPVRIASFKHVQTSLNYLLTNQLIVSFRHKVLILMSGIERYWEEL